MKPNRSVIHLTNVVVLLCVPLVSVAQEQPPPCVDLSPYETTQIKIGSLSTQVPSNYFLNRSPTPTYLNDTSTQVTDWSQELLGSPFFAVKGQQTEQQRVKLGRYDDNQQCFTKLLGWVDKSHLLHRIKPLRVGDVVTRFPQLKDQTLTDSAAEKKANLGDQSKYAQQQMSETNRLFLRVLSRPEQNFKPATTPGQPPEQASTSEIKMGLMGQLWRYVYAVEEINQQLWYLVGSKSQLINRHYYYLQEIDDTLTKEVQQGLLGWIPQKSVSEWSSNVVLEPNTDEKAVRERYDNKSMATLYQTADQTSPVMAQENPELWKLAIDGQVNDQTPARFAPLGLAPEIPRYFVKGYNPKTGWYHVASIGSTQQQPMTMTDYEIRAFLGKLRQLANHLRAVDVVFVVDSTYMGNEIESVKQFFNQLSRQLGKAHRQHNSMALKLPGGKLASIETNLDIKVSLVVYERQPEDITAQPRRLPDDQAVLDKEVNNILFGGETEDVHHALYSVINNPKYWRPYAHRAIIVMTDEPGDPISHNEQDVLNSLKQALQAPRETIKKLGGNPDQIDYRDYTQIWAIFTDNGAFDAFKGNMDSLTHSDRIIQIKDFVNNYQQRDQLLERFNETIYDLQLSVTDRLNQLAVQINADTQSNSRSNPTAAGSQTSPQSTSHLLLHQAAIEAVKQQLGIDSSVFFAALGFLAFVEGHTPKRMPGHQNDTYREVVLIERRDLRSLYGQAESFLQAFDLSFEKGQGSPQAIVAVALLQAVASVSGNDMLIDDLEELTIAELRRYARRWLYRRDVKNTSVAELIGLQDSLPIPSEGLFGMKPTDIQRMPVDDIWKERDQLALKIVCLKKILKGQTVPQDVNRCHVHQGQPKVWNYQPAGSSNTYIYLPLHLVP